MLKKAVFSAVLLSSMLSTSYASNNFFNKFSTLKHKPQISHSTENDNLSKDAYTDFTGTWQGSCEGDNGENFIIDIKNDAINLTLDGEEFSLGSLKSTNEATPYSSSGINNISVSWNASRTELLIQIVDLMKIHSKYPYNDPSLFSTYLSQVIMSLENEQLVVQLNHLGFEGLSKIRDESGKQICRFNRVH